MAPTERMLSVKNLQTHFHTERGVVKAVDDVSFDVGRGETVGIVGESGSGKSVTALSLMGLVPPPGKIAGGSIHFYGDQEEGVDWVKLPARQMRKHRGNDIGMIFQEPMTSLNPVFRCGDQVDEVTQLHWKYSKKQSKERTIELFRKVQLPSPERMYQSYPHQLSGGQKQRVMIAMAMAADPRILIADEPTTALDVTVQRAILELMADLKEKINASIIFITHDLGVMAEIADRVIVMYEGKIVEQGTVREIFTNPQHPYTQGLLACRPPLDKRLRRLPVVSDFLKEESSSADGQAAIRRQLSKVEVSAAETRERLGRLQVSEPIMRVKELSTWFPQQRNILGKTVNYLKAVDGVSFDVFSGETLGLVGESGCGKTTLGRTILRLQSKWGGEVWYKDQNVHELNAGELRKLRTDMQIIFQDPYSSLNPRIPIGTAISEPMQVHGIIKNAKRRKERTLQLLEQVGLQAEHYDRYPHEFSGGQRQRVCIARALSVNPRFIVCDESVSALDVSVQAQVLNLLLELREEYDLTYIFISHDLSVVKFMADRIMVMKDGQIMEMGEADEVYRHPKRDYTRKLIEAVPKGL